MPDLYRFTNSDECESSAFNFHFDVRDEAPQKIAVSRPLRTLSSAPNAQACDPGMQLAFRSVKPSAMEVGALQTPALGSKQTAVLTHQQNIFKFGSGQDKTRSNFDVLSQDILQKSSKEFKPEVLQESYPEKPKKSNMGKSKSCEPGSSKSIKLEHREYTKHQSSQPYKAQSYRIVEQESPTVAKSESLNGTRVTNFGTTNHVNCKAANSAITRKVYDLPYCNGQNNDRDATKDDVQQAGEPGGDYGHLQKEFMAHLKYLTAGTIAQTGEDKVAIVTEARTTPLFSGPVLTGLSRSTFGQYGLLASICQNSQDIDARKGNVPVDNRLLLNVSAPWSAFICGSQGSGKSHTLACMLEDCLIRHEISNVKNPLAGVVFHYDTFSGSESNQVCEAAYLASAGIPVKVLVSPTRYEYLKKAYRSLAGVPTKFQPTVIPLKLQETQLNVTRMKKLMAVSDNDGPLPLYMEVLMRILREMAVENQSGQGIDYLRFRAKLNAETFTGQQAGPLQLRLQLLEEFMVIPPKNKKVHIPANISKQMMQAWEFESGTLTIIDLSSPFVDPNAACALFNICLELFLDTRNVVGGIVALDEAHKYMNNSEAASNFTESLLQVIRQQRHLGTRVVIATQEPTISPSLLDLANMTIVHRFNSPAWFMSLRAHLAGATNAAVEANDEKSDNPAKHGRKLFQDIVRLNTGEALLFCPSAMLDLVSDDGFRKIPQKLGLNHVQIKIRRRITADGGMSVMSS